MNNGTKNESQKRVAIRGGGPIAHTVLREEGKFLILRYDEAGTGYEMKIEKARTVNLRWSNEFKSWVAK